MSLSFLLKTISLKKYTTTYEYKAFTFDCIEFAFHRADKELLFFFGYHAIPSMK